MYPWLILRNGNTGAININEIYQRFSKSYERKGIGPNEVGPGILLSLINPMLHNLCGMGFSVNRLDVCVEYRQLR